jgi:small subunit ribosomal protein S3Ae
MAKLVDSWKLKTWYSIIAPKFFKEVELSKTLASDEAHLKNRIIILPLKEITKDISHSFINVKLRVEEIKGNKAFTKFIGHSISNDYLSTLVRRGRDALRVVIQSKSKDEVEFTVKLLIVTAVKGSGRQKTSIRNKAASLLKERISKEDFNTFISNVFNGSVSNDLSSPLKKILPIKKVEVYKTALKEVFDVENIEQAKNLDSPSTNTSTPETSNEETTPV